MQIEKPPFNSPALDRECRTAHEVAVTRLRRALATLIVRNPVFRSKPCGAPCSVERMRQDEAIAAEDDARTALRDTAHLAGEGE